MIDTHTHIYMEEFSGENPGPVERALQAGVRHMVLPNVDSASVSPLLALHSAYPKATSIAMGLHPTSVDKDWLRNLEEVEHLLDTHQCVAVGEVGIDLYWDRTYRIEQMEAFSRQLDMAWRRGVPVIVHCREALAETLEVAASRGKECPPLLFHSFTGGKAEVARVREVCPDAMFGINGVVTFKNALDLHASLPEIGIGSIVLETDSPYLAPVPHRGRRNESSYLPAIRDRVAELLGSEPREVERVTDMNATRFFRLSEQGLN